MKYSDAMKKMEEYGQSHVLDCYEQLREEEKAFLLGQIERMDFSVIESSRNQDKLARKGVIAPLTAMRLEEIEKRREEFRQLGIEALKAGKAAALMLAGGMGTRLGSDAPKGMYDIGLTRPVYIFECQFRNLLRVVEETGAWVPLFIMTNEENHNITKSFLEEKDYFGYCADYITYFNQEMAPATDFDGRVLMEAGNKIAASPNGNGGWVQSMKRCGVLDQIKQAGIEWINVFAVDNVLQQIADPCFIGATIASGCVVGSKVVKKNAPDEKVGVMCLEDGKPSIVEYYELTEEMMETRDDKGEPAYNFGVILNYLFHEKELEELINQKPPLHVVKKKIPYMDANGTAVKPERENGYKYESLALDMIHRLGTCLPFEVVREKEFAPIKNKTGIDSVDSARELLRHNGVTL